MNVSRSRPSVRFAASILLAGVACAPVMAGAHTWDVNEAFTTADGRIWFVEIREANGTPNEVGVGNRAFTSTAKMFTICVETSAPASCNVASPTNGKTILFANPAYVELAAAQGAPSPDQVVNLDAFFDPTGDSLTYTPYDTWAVAAVPVDGINSLNRSGGAAANSPRNYAEQTGSIDASAPPPPFVPDGAGGTTPMVAAKLDPTGLDLRVTWDEDSCLLDANHHIVYGDRSQLPGAPAGRFQVTGGVCDVGGAGQFDWSSVPDAADGSGLLWWVVVANDGAMTEGSWGLDSSGERIGPGADDASEVCGMVARSLDNQCGR